MILYLGTFFLLAATNYRASGLVLWLGPEVPIRQQLRPVYPQEQTFWTKL